MTIAVDFRFTAMLLACKVVSSFKEILNKNAKGLPREIPHEIYEVMKDLNEVETESTRRSEDQKSAKSLLMPIIS